MLLLEKATGKEFTAFEFKTGLLRSEIPDKFWYNCSPLVLWLDLNGKLAQGAFYKFGEKPKKLKDGDVIIEIEPLIFEVRDNIEGYEVINNDKN